MSEPIAGVNQSTSPNHSRTPHSANIIASQLWIARQDLEAAQLLARTGNRNAIYHCQQAAEKIMGAVLTAEGQHHPKNHQLDEFVAMIPDENPVKPTLKALVHLTRYATSIRYPTETGRILDGPRGSALDAEIDRVALALEAVVARLGVDLERPGTPASTPAPIR